MPALIRLATWYETNQFPVAARTLYAHALDIRSESTEPDSGAALSDIELTRRLALHPGPVS